MDINDFLIKFADQFRHTPRCEFKPETNFWNIDEWSSLIAISVVVMVDEEYGVMLSAPDMKGVRTIQELYDVVKSKKA